MSSYPSERGSEPTVRFCLSDIIKVTLACLCSFREKRGKNIHKGLAQNGVENVRLYYCCSRRVLLDPKQSASV